MGVSGYIPEYNQHITQEYILLGYPATHPSMIKTITFGTGVPQSIFFSGIPGYILEYDHNNQVLVPSIYSGIPGYIPEYDQNDQVWHLGTLEYICPPLIVSEQKNSPHKWAVALQSTWYSYTGWEN